MNEINIILLALALVITYTTLEVAIIIAMNVKFGSGTGEESSGGFLPANHQTQSYYPDIMPHGISRDPICQRPYAHFLQGSPGKNS